MYDNICPAAGSMHISSYTEAAQVERFPVYPPGQEL